MPGLSKGTLAYAQIRVKEAWRWPRAGAKSRVIQNPLVVSLSNHTPISGGLSFDRLRMSGEVKSGDFAPDLGPRAIAS